MTIESDTTAVGDAAAAELLERALGARSPSPDCFEPAFLRKFPLRVVEQTVRLFLDEHGPLVRVERDGERWLARYERGEEPVRAVVTAEGRIRGLLVGPRAGDAAAAPDLQHRRRDVRRRLAFAAAVAIGMPPLLVLALWTASSVAAWLAFAVFGAGVLAASALVQPWWVVAAPLRVPLVAACALAGAASASRLPGLPTGRPEWWLDAVLAVGLAASLAQVRDRWERPRPPAPLRLRFPLAGGTYCVLQGGGRSVNRHASSAEQRYALDLVRLGRLGGRCSPPAVHPARLERYASWDAPVVAPCDALVVAAVDGVPDLAPPEQTFGQAAGNHVVLETGGVQVLLAHLRAGTVAVAEGDRIRAGQPLGRVGNSGASTEPHLHLHAARDGLGMPVVFEESGGRRLRRNALVRVRQLEAGGRSMPLT